MVYATYDIWSPVQKSLLCAFSQFSQCHTLRVYIQANPLQKFIVVQLVDSIK